MITLKERDMIDELLVLGEQDWITLSDVIHLAQVRSGLRDDDQLRSMAVGVVSRMLVLGLVVAGDVGPEGHQPWPCSTPEAVLRITTEWESRVDPFVWGGDICWLDLTGRGTQRTADLK